MRSPLLHFLLLGALLFAGQRTLEAARTRDEAQHVNFSAARLARLAADWEESMGRAPRAEEIDAAIDAAIDEEILFREALALGLHRDDPVVHQRLVRNLRFLGAGPDREDAELVREAFALELERSDLVVRRRLVERMRTALVMGRVQLSGPDLRAFYDTHAERYRTPERVGLTHVFLSRDRRGDALAADADALRARLEAGSLSPERALSSGDPFLGGHDFASLAPADAERVFGAAFAAAALRLEIGVWSRPIESAYGLHLVRIERREPGGVRDFAVVEPQVREALGREREQAALRAQLERLRARYRVVIERGA